MVYVRRLKETDKEQCVVAKATKPWNVTSSVDGAGYKLLAAAVLCQAIEDYRSLVELALSLMREVEDLENLACECEGLVGNGSKFVLKSAARARKKLGSRVEDLDSFFTSRHGVMMCEICGVAPEYIRNKARAYARETLP